MKEASPTRRTGDIVPFNRPTAYWHRRAMDNRRSKRFAEAVELLRRAAGQEPDNIEIKMDLAETLSEMECFEQSSRLLYQLLSRDPNLAECYYGLACNDYGLQKNEEALDALFHYLRLAPEGPYADDARDMLEALSIDDYPSGSSRGELLIRRGLKAFQEDRPHKATEHLKRALRISRDLTRVRTMLSLSLLSEGKPKEAFRHAMVACAKDPQSVQARCSLCCALWMMGKPRAAAGLLQEAARWCDSPYEELLFCHTASQLDQRELLLKFLRERSQWTPFRVGTLHSLAVAYFNLGHLKKAKGLWARILQIDPDDMLADYCHDLCERTLNGETDNIGQTLSYHPILPREENQRRLQLIAAALAGGEEKLRERWRSDGTIKKMVRWAFTLPDERLQGALLGVLSAVGPEGADVARELLTDDTLSEEVKRRAVLLLNRMGEPMPYVLTYRRRITQVQCAPRDEGGVPQWRVFMKTFIRELRNVKDIQAAMRFAAKLFAALPRAMREEASGERALQWAKAFEVLFLRREGREEDAQKVLHELPISARRIERVIRRLEKVQTAAPARA